MALNPQLTNLGANAEADAVTALLNNGYLVIFSGTQPTTGDGAYDSGGAAVILAELVFGATAFAGAIAGVATANAIAQDAVANATGTASWFRCYKSDYTPGTPDGTGTKVFDGSVGTSGANLNLNSVAIQAGAAVSVTSMTFTAKKS